jgi:hypothetical protein
MLRRGERPPGSLEELPAELLRLGLEYPDGRRASTFGGWVDGTSTGLGGPPDEDQPDPQKEIRLVAGSGGGDGLQTYQDYWVWPLPPSGSIRFVCEWPALEIPEAAVEIDADVIRGASERAKAIWD